MLGGELEPLESLSVHEGRRDALRAFLSGDGSVRSTQAPIDSFKGQQPFVGVGTALASLVDKWAAEKQPRPKTVSRTRNIAGEFETLVEALSVERITRQHIMRYKDALLAGGQSAANINIKIPMLGTLLNYAFDNGLISTKPTSGVRVADKRPARERRREFDAGALQAIFGSPVFTQGARPGAGAGEAAYWLPLLALFTGARIEELCQLSPDDIYEEEFTGADGAHGKAWVVRFTADRTKRQELKTEGSERRVPLHAELIGAGFVSFVEHAKEQGRARVFHQLRPDVAGKESGNFSKWFGRYLRNTCKVTDGRMVFHSFRHTFKHLARLAGISAEAHNAITGHVTGDVADNYGGLSYPLAPLVEAMRRYRVTGVTFTAFP
jgi:integrase